MKPYEARPEKIPPTDLYADIPCYGRYHPTPGDFVVDLEQANSASASSLQYWASVLELCTVANRIFPSDDQGREVFALGRLIVKSSHLHRARTGQCAGIDYTYADANEVQAIAVAKTALKGIRIPDMYFSGKVCGLPTGVPHVHSWPVTHTSRRSTAARFWSKNGSQASA